MFIVVYEAKVIDRNFSRFEEAWGIVTDAIREHCNSLGSRLHRTDDESVYIAYAQWPDKSTFENAQKDSFSETQKQAGSVMRGSVEYFKIVYTAEVCDDRLVVNN